jgi:hypothetical protein
MCRDLPPIELRFSHFMTYQLELSVGYMVEKRHNSYEDLTHKRIFHQLHSPLPKKAK